MSEASIRFSFSMRLNNIISKGKKLLIVINSKKRKNQRVATSPFCSIWVFFHNHPTAGEGGGHFLNSSLPLPPASQTLRH